MLNDIYQQHVAPHFTDAQLWVGVTMALHLIVFWSVCGFFTLADVYQWEWMKAYKVQPGQNAPLEPGRLRAGLKRAVLNQLLMFVVMLAAWPVVEKLDLPFRDPLPSLSVFLRDMFVIVMVEEIGFYYSHRLLHVPFLYKRIHKIHHEWKASVSFAAIYAHPIEHLLSNVFPIALGPLLMRSHVTVFWFWAVIAIISTIISHSGYHLFFLPSSEFHDFHHLKFDTCFGVIGLLDYLHGTDRLFRDSPQFKNHHVILPGGYHQVKAKDQ